MTSFRDVELLSAYLDGQLGPSDSTRLEARISAEAGLRTTLDDLRASRSLLRQLPQRRAPRNFTLTPRMAGLKPPEPRSYPTLRFATVLATLLFIATFAINGLAPVANSSFAAAPAPAFGMGGGGGAGSAPQQAPATEAPARPFAAMSPTEATPLTTQSLAPTEATTPLTDQTLAPTETPYAKSIPPQLTNSAPTQVPNEAPVPLIWQIGLAIIAILLGIVTWLNRRTSENKFRRQWK